MDKESIRRQFITTLESLKTLGVPQEDIDKAILDYDLLASEMNDVDALRRFSNELTENIKYNNNLKRNNPDGSTTEIYKNMQVNSDVPLEEFTALQNFKGDMPEWFDDLKGTPEYATARTIKGSLANEIRSKKFANLGLTMYEIFEDYAKNLSTRDKQLLLELINNRTIRELEDKYLEIERTPDEKLSLQQLDEIDNALIDMKENFKDQLPGMLDSYKLEQLDKEANTPESKAAQEAMDWEEAHKSTDGWPPDDPKEWGIEEYYNKIDKNNPEGILSEEEWNAKNNPQYDEINNQVFDDIVNNDKSIHWWRYDESASDEFKDYMERYTTGQLTDEEIQELIKGQDVDDARRWLEANTNRWDNEINNSAAALNISDTNAWKKLVGVGMRVLGAIDEDIIYSPLKLAQKGLNKLGLTTAAKGVGAVYGAATGYEQYLFYGIAGLAALTQAGPAIKGVVRDSIKLPSQMAQGILDLYGTGMDKRLIPEVPVPEPEKSEYIPTKQEQARIQQERFYNLMDAYTNLSPVLAAFRYAILPKTGYADPIDFYRQTGAKSMDNISRMFTPKQEPKRGRQ